METPADCHFCTYPAKHPEWMIRQEPDWYVTHVDRFFPEGSLFLVAKRHGLLAELTAQDWRSAAPLIAACSRMLTAVGGAERTYLASYSERNLHFHLLMVNKHREHSEKRNKRFGSLLMASFVEEDRANDPGEVDRYVKAYRDALPKYLTAGPA